jgi:hypothetical protein
VTAVAAGIRKLWSARGGLLPGIQFGAEFGQFRTALSAEFGQVRTALSAEFGQVRTALSAEFGQFGAEFGDNLERSAICKFVSKFDRSKFDRKCLSTCAGRFCSTFDKQFGALFVEA